MKTTLTLLALLGLITFTNAFAESTGIRENQSEVSSFCRDRLTVLKSAYRQAELEAQVGNVAQSESILEKGLLDSALRINPRFEHSLTSKAIKRGIILLNSLKATPNDRQKLRTLNNFLFNYYIFIEDVSHKIDIPYFSYDSGFSRIVNSNLEFEKLFISFAKDQVQMVLNTMTTKSREGRFETIYPIGSTELLLTALRVTTEAMSNDLSESIFASKYACTINSLDSINQDIADYLSGTSNYSDDFIAVQELVKATEKAINGVRECSF